MTLAGLEQPFFQLEKTSSTVGVLIYGKLAKASQIINS